MPAKFALEIKDLLAFLSMEIFGDQACIQGYVIGRQWNVGVQPTSCRFSVRTVPTRDMKDFLISGDMNVDAMGGVIEMPELHEQVVDVSRDLSGRLRKVLNRLYDKYFTETLIEWSDECSEIFNEIEFAAMIALAPIKDGTDRLAELANESHIQERLLSDLNGEFDGVHSFTTEAFAYACQYRQMEIPDSPRNRIGGLIRNVHKLASSALR